MRVSEAAAEMVDTVRQQRVLRVKSKLVCGHLFTSKSKSFKPVLLDSSELQNIT